MIVQNDELKEFKIKTLFRMKNDLLNIKSYSNKINFVKSLSILSMTKNIYMTTLAKMDKS